MGVSTNGMLYFGFQIGDEDEKPEWLEGFDDFDDFLVAKAGLSDAPYEDRAKVIHECPADLHTFCSYDYPMHILGLRSAGYVVHRGYTVEIDPAKLAIDQSKIDALKAWCAANGIKWQEPKWLLCSLWG